MLEIVAAKVIVTCPGRNFVTLKVTTRDGLTGLGDATLNGRELAVASYLSDHVIPCPIGRDVHRIEDTWQYLYRGAYWRRGPVTMAAALHFDLSVPNFGIQEYMRHTEETDAVFPHAYAFADGSLHPGEAPGLGVDVDEELAARYPYCRAYLPVNRLEDGSMHDW